MIESFVEIGAIGVSTVATSAMIDGTREETRRATTLITPRANEVLVRPSFLNDYLSMPSSLMKGLSLVITMSSITSERQERMGLSLALVCPESWYQI